MSRVVQLLIILEMEVDEVDVHIGATETLRIHRDNASTIIGSDLMPRLQAQETEAMA